MVVSRKDILSVFSSAGISVDLSGIRGDDSLKDAGVDSLDKMSFLFGLEEKFNIKILDEDIEALDTIDNIIAYLDHF